MMTFYDVYRKITTTCLKHLDFLTETVKELSGNDY